MGLRIGAAVVAAGVVASCNSASAIQRDGDAQEISPKIVSLNPCTDAILIEVANPEQVLAISHYSHDPSASSVNAAKANRFLSSGGTVEEIAALNPDIVFAGTFIAPGRLQALNDLKFRTELFGSTNRIEESLTQIRDIGAITGNSENAKQVISRIEQSLAKHKRADGQQLTSVVLWQPGQIVPGEATLISELLEHVGFSSHSQSRGLGQADYLPLENILADPPELLLIAGDARAQQHPALDHLENTRVESFDPSLLYCGGPTIIRATERLAEIREAMQ